MHRDTFEVVFEPAGLDALPLRSHQAAPPRANMLGLFAMTTLAALVVVPQIALAGYALISPDIRQSLIDQPVAAAQLAVALMFWIALFAWPIKRLLGRINRHRDVEISQHRVCVRDQHLFGSRQWDVPLNSYRGIAHHIRSSLSGTRHELVLVHPDPAQTVILMTAPMISAADISRLMALLGLPEIAASELYWRNTGTQMPAKSLSLSAVPA